MRSNSGRPQLGKNEFAMAEEFVQSAGPYSPDQFLSSKSALAGRTPDVYAFGIQNQDPGVSIGQFTS